MKIIRMFQAWRQRRKGIRQMTIEYPSWEEIVVTMAVILTEIWIFRWVVTRMPVLRESPSWVKEEEESNEEKVSRI